MSVFSDLAEAVIALREAERDQIRLRVVREQDIVEQSAGGVKSLGPNIVDQERAFAVLLSADERIRAADERLWDAEARVERAKALVREYECHAAARRLPD